MHDSDYEEKEDLKTSILSDKEDVKNIGILADFKKIHEAQQLQKFNKELERNNE